MECEALDWWRDIVYTDGKLDEGQVLDELVDYYHVLREVPKVYCAITDNRMSKPNYAAADVISEYEECNYNKRCTRFDIEQMVARNETLEGLRAELTEYFEIMGEVE